MRLGIGETYSPSWGNNFFRKMSEYLSRVGSDNSKLIRKKSLIGDTYAWSEETILKNYLSQNLDDVLFFNGNEVTKKTVLNSVKGSLISYILAAEILGITENPKNIKRRVQERLYVIFQPPV